MIYNKTEKRVISFLPFLYERRYTEIGNEIAVTAKQYIEYTDEKGEAFSIDSYPYSFGKEGYDTHFSFALDVPDISDDVYLYFPIETDGLLLINGEPECNVNPFHEYVNISKCRGNNISFSVTVWDGYIYPGFHPLNDTHLLTVVGKHKLDYPILLKKPAIVIKNNEQYELYYDLKALVDTVLTLPEKSLQREQTMARLHDALLGYSLVEDNLEELERQAREVRKTTKKLLKAVNGTFCPESFALGMAHLDHAWLWAIRETDRKSVRTISGMTHLMEEYPEFVFLSTQPVQMETTFKKYPSLYEKVKRFFENKQWDPNGVGLVEADNMISSGEGLIRNFLYGRESTEKLFPGYNGDCYIVPDSFGYNGNLPQIMKGCRVKYFVTSKLSWNDTNKFPFEVFSWKGIDGSEIKSYMIPGQYTGTNNPSEIISMWDRITNKDIQTKMLRTIGEGDGGGGTTRDDIELLKRVKNLQGCPKSSWKTLSDSLDSIFSSSGKLPVYSGELYFELHRGTYTSQARTKQGYRRINALLHNAEYLAIYRWVKGYISYNEMTKISKHCKELWRQTVIYQFHDILPGSSVRPVYEETEAFYSKAITDLEGIVRKLVGKGSNVLNMTPFAVNGLLPYSSGDYNDDIVSSDKSSISLSWGKIKLDKRGTITSILYKDREILSGHGNMLMLGEDIPLSWDAWDIDKDSLDRLTEVEIPYDRLTREGQIGKNSYIKQDILIHRNKARIDFVTEVDWHENHKILRAEFPTTIFSENAIFDIPFGFLERSTKENNSFEYAQFESPAQSFVALKDSGLSVALISDSKYGFSAKNGKLGISLLKSAKAPDPTADMGCHRFIYSLYITDLGIESVIKEAALINNPFVFGTDKLEPMIIVSDGLAVECVKLSEDEKDIVFRVREYLGKSIKGTLVFDTNLDSSSLLQTNMLEEVIGKPTFDFHPFEVKTYRIRRKDN